MANLILVIIAVAVIGFIWLMWLRYSLTHALSEVNHHEHILMKDLEKRRDTVPYLLESYRKVQEPDDAWHKLLSERAQFHEHVPMEKEWEFEKSLLHFIQEGKVKTQNYLEAKKDIEDLTMLIEKKKQEMQKAKEAFNAKKTQAPYSFAAKVFGF